MDARMQVKPPKGLRAKIREKVKARVRYWVDGHQYRYFDTYGSQWVDAAYPSYPSLKVLETVPEDRNIPITVGKYAGIHYTTLIIPGGVHRFDWVSAALPGHVVDGEWHMIDNAITAKGPVHIGNDVFIAFEVIITSGVTIGDGAVIATRAVVTRDVEPYAIYGGNPAKLLKYRFEEPVRKALLRISWWDWSDEKVAAHDKQIHSAEVEDFVAKHDAEWPEPRECEICAMGKF